MMCVFFVVLLQRLERFSNFKIWFRCDILLALFLNERYLKMKKSTLVVSALSALLLSGCSSMFTGTDQPVEVRTHHEEVGDKLDHVATFTVIGDAYRVKYQNVQAGEQVVLHRKKQTHSKGIQAKRATRQIKYSVFSWLLSFHNRQSMITQL